jgi:glycosyltransferase involved in cell wall biosynthesis
MRKIIHVITTISIGGAEKHLLALATEQVRRGLDVEVIYLKGEPELLEEFNSCGVSVKSDFANKGFLLQCLSIGRYLRNSYSLVHAHLPRAETLVAIANRNNPALGSRHNAEAFYPGKNKYLSVTLSRLVTAKNKNLIAISEAVRDFLVSSCEVSKETPMEVIHYGFRFSTNASGPGRGLHSGDPVFGTISRLTPQKDLQTLLKAFSIYHHAHEGGKLRILGVGPQLSLLKDLAKELGIHANVEFASRTRDVQGFLSSLDVFILTSKYEGFGLVLLEAIEAQIPIIATNSSAIPEVLGSDFPGLVGVGEHESVANQMSGLLQPDQRDKFLKKQNDRKRLFSLDQMCSATNNYYDCVIDDFTQRKA